ncbi:MAG: flavin-containing monooxygenase, partial [Parasphingopyxis sp.]
MSAGQMDVAIVGAGFSGLYLLHTLREMGLSSRVFEAGGDVGGTWYWNRYPGARCDIESVEYSYSWSEELEQEWNWSERYSTQPEILAYINHVADRFDLRRDIRFNTRVEAATYDEGANLWTVKLDSGESVSARHVVMATGCLSSPNLPEIPGMEDFEGPAYQTGLWPHEGVDFTGQKVGVIGTGSSAIQSIPVIAEQAAELVVMQRTPNFVVPAHNRPLGADEIAEAKARYPALRAQARDEAAGFLGSTVATETTALDTPEAERTAEFQKRWDRGGLSFMASYPDIGMVMEAND